MAGHRLFLLFALICMSKAETTSTPPTTTPAPIVCEYNGVLYNPSDKIALDSCNTGYCNEYGEIVPDIPCCEYEQGGKLYKPGEYVHKSQCGFARCSEDGVLEYGCMFCPEYCDEYSQANRDCCPPCKDRELPVAITELPKAPTTQRIPVAAPETTLPTATPERFPAPVPENICWQNNIFYFPGDVIYSDECSSLVCTDSGDVMWVDRFCPTETFSTPTPETSPPETSPPEPPSTPTIGCDYNKKLYNPGEYIENSICGSIRCTEDGYLEYGCMFCPEYCDEYSEANIACCPPCIDRETPTEQPSTPTPDTTPSPPAPAPDTPSPPAPAPDTTPSPPAPAPDTTPLPPAPAPDTTPSPPAPAPDSTSPPALAPENGCWQNNIFYYPYSSIPTGDPCTYCECPDGGGDVLCSEIFCSCDEGYVPITKPGECCSGCEPEPQPTFTPERGCRYNGKSVEPGRVDTGTPCYVCECPQTGGDLMCYYIDCMYPFGCPDDQVNIQKPGECCPLCVSQ